MSDHRQRGAHPSDARFFAERALPTLRRAVDDLSWLLGRGYSEVASLKLVGDRFQLARRQRAAVARCACSDEALASRAARRQMVPALAGAVVHVDAFNTLITLERALCGGPVLVGRDRACRDLAGVHGTWRAVSQTPHGIDLVGRCLTDAGSARVCWYVDQPVSNSGRLAALLRESAERAGWPWEVEVLASPDPRLAAAEGIVVTSDAWILDGCGAWFGLVEVVIEEAIPGAWKVDLGVGAERGA